MGGEAASPNCFDFSSRAGCLKALEKCAEEVLAGRLDPRQARALGFLIHGAVLALQDPSVRGSGSRIRRETHTRDAADAVSYERALLGAKQPAE